MYFTHCPNASYFILFRNYSRYSNKQRRFFCNYLKRPRDYHAAISTQRSLQPRIPRFPIISLPSKRPKLPYTRGWALGNENPIAALFATGFHRWNGRQSSRQETYPSLRQRSSFLVENCDGTPVVTRQDHATRHLIVHWLAERYVSRFQDTLVRNRTNRVSAPPIAEVGKEIEDKLLLLRVFHVFPFRWNSTILRGHWCNNTLFERRKPTSFSFFLFFSIPMELPIFNEQQDGGLFNKTRY